MLKYWIRVVEFYQRNIVKVWRLFLYVHLVGYRFDLSNTYLENYQMNIILAMISDMGVNLSVGLLFRKHVISPI